MEGTSPFEFKMAFANWARPGSMQPFWT